MSSKLDGLNKLKTSISKEKDAALSKVYTINNAPNSTIDERFDKASNFLGDDKNHNSLNEKNIKKSKKIKLVTSTFSVPEDEFAVVLNTIKTLLSHDTIIKQTEVFRIALHLLNKASKNEIYEAYNSLRKISAGKPKP